MTSCPSPHHSRRENSFSTGMSGLLCQALRRRADLVAVSALPVALLLEAVGDLLRHVLLVVFGEHAVSLEDAGHLQRALRHHALALAEKVGKKALVGHRDAALAVGHLKAHREVLAPHHAAFLD